MDFVRRLLVWDDESLDTLVLRRRQLGVLSRGRVESEPRAVVETPPYFSPTRR